MLPPVAPAEPSGVQVFVTALQILAALADLVVMILVLLWIRRSTRALESTARSAGAAQEALRQIQTATVTVAKQVTSP